MAGKPRVVEEMPSVALARDEFERRFRERFRDPYFDEVELDAVIDAAWRSYSEHRKAPLQCPGAGRVPARAGGAPGGGQDARPRRAAGPAQAAARARAPRLRPGARRGRRAGTSARGTAEGKEHEDSNPQ